MPKSNRQVVLLLLATFGLLMTVVATPAAAAPDPGDPYYCPTGGPNQQTVPYVGQGPNPDDYEVVLGEREICSSVANPCSYGAVVMAPSNAIRCLRSVTFFCQSKRGGWYREGNAASFVSDGSFFGVNYWLTVLGTLPVPAPDQTASVLELTMLPDFTEADADTLRLYEAFFTRDPDLEGAQYWYETARSGPTLDDIAWSFSQSTEFVNRYGTTTDEQFLDIIYQNVLGRDYDQEGFDYWLGQINAGLDRSGVVRWIAAGAEFINENPFPDQAAYDQLGPVGDRSLVCEGF